MRAAAIAMVAGALGCASARTPGEVDAADPIDAADPVDAAALDAAAPDAASPDAAVIDAAAPDAAVIDARPIDAAPPVDARVIDATPIDAACTPTWQNLLVNGAFDGATVAPWTQTSTIIRPAASMPFAPQSAPNAAEFGASNNANDVLVQTVTIPASATAVRVRGYQCHVTEDPITDADTFKVTLETPGGAVLETFTDITNSDVAPICVWLPFEWTATAPHAGQPVVLRLQGRTNLAFLTRFIVDGLSLEAQVCP